MLARLEVIRGRALKQGKEDAGVWSHQCLWLFDWKSLGHRWWWWCPRRCVQCWLDQLLSGGCRFDLVGTFPIIPFCHVVLIPVWNYIQVNVVAQFLSDALLIGLWSPVFSLWILIIARHWPIKWREACFQEVLLNPYVWTSVEKDGGCCCRYSRLVGTGFGRDLTAILKLCLSADKDTWCDSANVVNDMPQICGLRLVVQSSGSLVASAEITLKLLTQGFWTRDLWVNLTIRWCNSFVCSSSASHH